MAPPVRLDLTLGALADALASSVGRDASNARVREAARRLGIADRHLEVEEARKILALLGAEPGIVGIAARFADSRLASYRAADPPTTSEPGGKQADATAAAAAAPSPERGAKAEAAPSPDRPRRAARDKVPRSDLVALLAGAVGQETAARLVADAARKKGIAGLILDHADAVELLESLSGEAGGVGAAARFAKARLLLR